MARWTPEQMPSPAGLRVVVTGSNTGIGYEAAKVFAERGAHVTLACRNMEKAEAAKDRILAGSPSGTVDAMMLDLADLESVQAFADAFLEQHDRLDRLVLNAGVMIPPLGRTAQGFELQFGVNHLGHFALTCRLDPILRATDGARVTAMTSVAGDMGRMWWDDVNWEQRKYVRWQAYGQSKLANQLFVRGLAARVPYATTLAHPGWAFFGRVGRQRVPSPLHHERRLRCLADPAGGDGAGRRSGRVFWREGADPTARPAPCSQARQAGAQGRGRGTALGAERRPDRAPPCLMTLNCCGPVRCRRHLSARAGRGRCRR